jgi:delta 1-pyrroline-5-carboxylate dehydrogenase
MNPLFNQFGNNGSFVNQLKNQAMQLKQTVAHPKAEVERLLQSGQMSQEQFNVLKQQAEAILPYFK